MSSMASKNDFAQADLRLSLFGNKTFTLNRKQPQENSVERAHKKRQRIKLLVPLMSDNRKAYWQNLQISDHVPDISQDDDE